MATTQPKGAGAGSLDEGLQLVVPGKSLPAGAGWEWIAGGWKLFLRAPLMWIIALVILFVIAIVLAIIPFVGSIVFQLLQAVFAGGLIVACRSLERGGDFELEHVFAGFKTRFVPLLVVGLIFMVASLVLLVLFFVVAGISLLPAFLSGDPGVMQTALAGSAIAIVFGSLVMLALFVPVLMAYWFAPALVMMHDMAPVAAMKESFRGCLRNIVPFLVYGFIMTVLAIVAVIPFGLGLLVLAPVAMASNYVGYRQIFTADSAPVAPRPTMV